MMIFTWTDGPAPKVGFTINWDEVDEGTNPFQLGSASGRGMLGSSPPLGSMKPTLKTTANTPAKKKAVLPRPVTGMH